MIRQNRTGVKVAVHVLFPLACCQVTSKAAGIEGKHREQSEGISSWTNRAHYGGVTVVVDTETVERHFRLDPNALLSFVFRVA